jgi:hypothetical protein
LGRHLEGISSSICLGSHRGEGSSASHWLDVVVALVTLALRPYWSCRGCPAFGKTAVGVLCLHRPAPVLLGGVASRLLAQPALRVEPVFSCRSHGDSWDASQHTAWPVVRPLSHPHDTSPRNWRSLMGQHGASAGSSFRQSLARPHRSPRIFGPAWSVEAWPCGIFPAVSGRTISGDGPAGGRETASREPA